MITVVGPRISTTGEGQSFFDFDQEQRDDYAAWLDAAGAGVEDLVGVEYHVADEPLLRLTRKVRDEEGRVLVTLDDDKQPVPLTETAEIRCTIELPEWWWPCCPQYGATGKLRLNATTVRCRSCRMVRLVTPACSTATWPGGLSDEPVASSLGAPALQEAGPPLEVRLDAGERSVLCPLWRPVMTSRQLTVTGIYAVLASLRFRHHNEEELQRGIGAALLSAGFPVEREAYLAPGERIDLLVQRVGIEVKVKGPTVEVRRQLARYALSGAVDHLILVSTRAGHLRLNGEILHGIGVLTVRPPWL